MIDKANEIISSLTSTAQGAGALVAVVMVLIALVVGRTLVKVLSTIVLVGIVLFAVAKPDYFKDKVGEDFEGSLGRPPTAVVGPPPSVPLPVGSAGPAAS